MNITTTLDIRQTPPPQKHPMIFQTFASLTPGQGFILINDHDPKPLYYQFVHEHGDSSHGNISMKVPTSGGCRSVARNQINARRQAHLDQINSLVCLASFSFEYFHAKVNISYLTKYHPERQRRVSGTVVEMLRFAQHDTLTC